MTDRASRLDLYEWYDPINDLLECLICHKFMKSVANHVIVHNINSKEYREKYNIYRTTPLSSKSFLESRRKNMLHLRAIGEAVVSERGVVPPQLVGKEVSRKKGELLQYREFDSMRRQISVRHKDKKLSIESRKKIAKSHMGKIPWNKSDPVIRKCIRCSEEFSCMRWKPNKYCSKKCAALNNKNWLYRDTSNR